AFEGIAQLLRARAVNGGAIRWNPPDGVIQFTHAVVSGFSASEIAVFAQFMRKREPTADPIFNRLGRLSGPVVTRTRAQLVSDTEWYGSISFNEYRRVVGVDQCVYTLYALPSKGTYNLIGLHRAIKDAAFSPREQKLLHLFHEELGRLIGSALKN